MKIQEKPRVKYLGRNGRKYDLKTRNGIVFHDMEKAILFIRSQYPFENIYGTRLRLMTKEGESHWDNY